VNWCWNGDRGWCALEGRFALIDGCRWVAYDRFCGEVIDQGVEETTDAAAKRAERALEASCIATS
jgi:hypothetical protein